MAFFKPFYWFEITGNSARTCFVKFITLVFEVPLFDHKYLQYSLLKRDDVSCQQRADVITSHLIS